MQRWLHRQTTTSNTHLGNDEEMDPADGVSTYRYQTGKYMILYFALLNKIHSFDTYMKKNADKWVNMKLPCKYRF